MNSFEGKRILALIREGDYAHAGEEEAIERAMRSIPKKPKQSVLDVGCGRGGTTDYLRRHGWGNVCGIDRDAESIEYAKANYPGVEFHACDVLEVPRTVRGRFDVIYMLNAFYAFPNQGGALAALREVAAPGARLVIFDYTVGAASSAESLDVQGQVLIPHAIRLSEIPAMLRQSGWEPGAVEDLSSDYVRWYSTLVERISGKREAIEQVGGAEWYEFVLSMYSGLRDTIARGVIGGAIVRAVAG